MFASSEDSEVEEVEVPTPQRRRNKGTEADAKASSTQHPREESRESARKMRRCKASSSTSASQSRGQSASRSVSKENRRRRSRPNSKVKTKTNKLKVGSISSSDSSSSSDEAEGNQVARPKHMLKFWAQLTNCAKHNQWTWVQKLAYLRSSLDRAAANVLWQGGDGFVIKSYEDVTDEIRGTTFADKHLIEQRNRRRKPEETLHGLHSNIRSLAALAVPAVEHQSRGVMACN